MYALGGSLLAVGFDVRRLEMTGTAEPIVEGVLRVPNPTSGAGTAQFSFSNTGSLVYIPGPSRPGASPQGKLALVDRKGTVEALKVPPGDYEHPRVSPDGRLLTYGTDDGKEAIVWMYELSGARPPRRLTFGGNNRFPLWSADGEWVAFQSDREGDRAVFRQRALADSKAERLTKPDEGTSHVPESWSPDGKTLLYRVARGSSVTLWTLALEDKTATRFDEVESLSVAIDATFSPDGRWVAYTTRLNGDPTIFVQPFPASGAISQIPLQAGHPLWSRDGKELFGTGNGLFAVAVTTRPGVAFGNPESLLRVFSGGGPQEPRFYDETPDRRFVGVIRSDQGDPRPQSFPTTVHVVLNWFEELKRLVPVN